MNLDTFIVRYDASSATKLRTRHSNAHYYWCEVILFENDSHITCVQNTIIGFAHEIYA